MKLIKNSGQERVVDELRKCLSTQTTFDIASPAFSLFAFGEVRELLAKIDKCRLVIPSSETADLALLGSVFDRPFRNRLQVRSLAKQCAEWIEKKAEIKQAPGAIPQATLITGSADPQLNRVIIGSCAFTTEGLGITPGNQFGLIQLSESLEECALLGSWFTGLWNSLSSSADAKNQFLAKLKELIDHKQPSLVYGV